MPSAEYLADDVIESAKLRGALTVGTFSSGDYFRIATEETRTDLAPLILSAREEYFTVYADYTPTPDTTDPTGGTMGPFRLPGRAVASKARLVQLIDSNGAACELGRVPIEAIPYSRIGFYPRGNSIYVLNKSGVSYAKVRIFFHLRTNSLVPVTKAAFVQSFDPVAQTVTVGGYTYDADTRDVMAASAPAWSSGTFDLIQSSPPFDVLAYDQPATVFGSILSFSGALPTGLQVGDQVSIAGQTAIVPLPVEFHPVLAQAITVKALETEGDAQGLGAAKAQLNEMKAAALKLITNRVEGNPKLIISTRSPWRRWY